MNDNRVLKGSVCAALGGVFWGFSGTCGQYLFSEFGVSSLWVTCLQTRRPPRKKELLALALALFGTFMLATGGHPGELLLSSQGLFWGLATAAAVAAYTLIPRGLMTRWSREAISGIGMIFGGIVLNLYARSWEFEVSLPLSGWLAFGCVVIFGTVVSFTLFLRGIQDAGAVRASMLCVTEPLSAAVFSALWLGTRFSSAELIGFAAILATMFLLTESE